MTAIFSVPLFLVDANAAAYPYFIAMDNAQPRLPPQGITLACNLVRQPCVIGIQERNPVTRRGPDPGIACMADAVV